MSPASRAGGFAHLNEDRPSERRCLEMIVLSDEQVLVGADEARLGLSEAQAQRARAEFAEVLYRLTRHLADRARDVGVEANSPASPADDSRLRLDPADCRRFLVDLRRLGAGLRGLVADDLVRTLQRQGFPAIAGAEGPALTFTSRKSSILWDMLYEGSHLGEPDWREFWGFRTPITHWLLNTGAPAGEAIPVRNGMFSAISEDLPCAGREAADLTAHLERQVPGLRHARLTRALRERVQRERPSAPADAGRPGWLRDHLGRMDADAHDSWIFEALVEILRGVRSRQGLLHFACHGVAEERTDLLSQLRFHIDGEALCLHVAALAGELARPATEGRETGPLVFLNACNTAHPSPEPPGFPTVWSRYGALAVLATLCPVPDHFAHAFAVKFYELLFRRNGGPRTAFLAEAFHATRRYFMEAHNNPLGLSYVLFARPRVFVRAAPEPVSALCAGGV